MSKPLCIYHGGCDDGFVAAWCVNVAMNAQVDFFPGVYQKEPPPHDGRDVIFVDFSYKRPVLEAMAQRAASILILDHHKTAQEDLADIAEAPRYVDWRSAASIDGSGNRMFALFDMERSGAALAWDYFIGDGSACGWAPGQARHNREFIEYIQDRDLWRKQLPGGDEFTIALRSYPQDFATWDMLIARGAKALIEEGKAVQRYYRLRVEELKQSAYPAQFEIFDKKERWRVVRAMVANAPYFAASEVAGELASVDGFDFGACYFEVERGRYQYSLRSRGSFDVSEVARAFGGGGHKAAAGFTVSVPVHQEIATAAQR